MKRVVGYILGRRAGAMASFIVAFHFAAELAMAQKTGRVANDEGEGMTPMLIAAGVVVVVSLSAFINPKRSHLN